MNKSSKQEKVLFFLAIVCPLASTLFWLATSGQPLVDQHDFRQAQTALTSLYLQPSIKGILNYETPVLGSPWSIPFEFPLYQFFAYLIDRILPLPLDSAGRLLGAIFGFFCVFPAKGLMQLFRIKKDGLYCFIVLYFSSSIYLYWNRAFLIESMALFYTLSSLYLYFKIRLNSHQHCKSMLHLAQDYLLFFVVLLLGLLTKVTTLIPSFILIAFDVFASGLTSLLFKQKVPALSKKDMVLCSICLLVSLATFKSWLMHADDLKSMNQIGQSFTSEMLRSWNYGSFGQRFGKELWVSVVIQRMLTPAGLLPAIFLISAPIFASLPSLKDSKVLRGKIYFILACVLLAITPFLLFPNLHIVHSYYQCANQIFILMALAASFSLGNEVFYDPRIKILIYFSVLIFVAGSLFDFSYSSGYLRSALVSTNDKLEVGKFIQDSTSSKSAILVIGDGWNPAFSYHSKRKSLSLPKKQRIYATPQQALDRSREWLGGNELGAIIERVNNKRQVSTEFVCLPKLKRQIGEWQVSICS